MVEKIIHKYIQDLNRLREDEREFKKYTYTLSEDGKRDLNQFNRFTIGVGLFNDLRVPDDYSIVRRLFEEEVKHRHANTDNYDFEVIYMYCYFLSEFGVIEDIWDFAALKFDGTMDADSGFETGFFLTYGKEKLRHYVTSSNHRLQTRIIETVFSDETLYSEDSGKAYKEQQIAYLGLKKPVGIPLGFYMRLHEKEYFKAAFETWKSETDLTDKRNAYEYVNFAEYLGEEGEIRSAMENHVRVNPRSWMSDKYKKLLNPDQNKSLLHRIINWFMK